MTDEPAEVVSYTPTVSAQRVEQLRAWHEATYERLRSRTDERVTYLGRSLDVPAGVFPPAPVSALLGRAVLAETRETDRVLDMGTGCGVNAILAAERSSDVTGVDVNPAAVEAARANARLNGVADRTGFRVSDVFADVHGTFDLIIFDPPFRWFAPRDTLEMSVADRDYRALTRFMSEAGRHLSPDGRILLFFGTSGDVGHLTRLVAESGWRGETLDSHELVTDTDTVSYFTYRLTHA